MPAMVIEAPLGIRCVFSDGRRAEYHLDDLPSPRLARDLAAGLADLIHPHGTADSGGTVVLYVRALRSMVRALAAAGFTGGAADLRRGQLAEFWMAGPMRLEALTRSMVEGFAAIASARASSAFRAVNGLPSSLYPPAWAIMQLGAFGAAPAAAARRGWPGTASWGRLLAGGTGAWALSKVAKRMVRRPRPAILLPGTRCRGPEAAGLGYLSGHAGVAVALGAAALPRLGTAGRALTLSAVPVVGLTRVYVGAHLPLDVAGGMALGLAIEAAMTLVNSCMAEPAPRESREHH